MLLPPDFSESKTWPAVLEERTLVRAEPAVYMLLHDSDFGRLRGSSRILYIGSTRQLGGASQSCRLRIYRYPNGRHASELRRAIQLLLDSGVGVTISWKHLSSASKAKSEEARLLSEYKQEHHELPPLNARSEGVPKARASRGRR